MSSEKTIVEVKNLKKSYGSLEVLRDVSFSVKEGEIFAILGPNGAGKTTCVEILEGYRNSDSGQISVLGHDPIKAELDFKERIGIVVQATGIENELTAREALGLYGSAYKNPKTPDELLELVQLQEKADVRIDKFSGGQKRRLDLALGLVGNPDLIFLDEPTTGFSPEARREAWEMLANLRSLGKTILLTSHYMEEVERLADRMVILLDGKIAQEGRPQDLRQGFTNIKFTLPPDWDEKWFRDFFKGPHHGIRIEKMDFQNREVSILTLTPTAVLAKLTSTASGGQVELENLNVHLLGLEDIYLKAIEASNAGRGESNTGKESAENE